VVGNPRSKMMDMKEVKETLSTKAEAAMKRPIEENPVDQVIVNKLPDTDNEEVDKVYQARWVWYHTLLALELFFTNLFLFILIIVTLVK
jgi:hypothetical protein